MHISHTIQYFYIFCTISALLLSSISGLRTRFITYGARAVSSTKDDAKKSPAESSRDNNKQMKKFTIDDYLQVPHSWFTYFYVVCVSATLFWGIQFLISGRILTSLIFYDNTRNNIKPTYRTQSTMTFDQILLTWSLLLIQGTRRLYESLLFSKPSTSKMSIVAWLLGISYYIATSMAVWAEGTPTLLHASAVARPNWSSIFLIRAPSLRTFICLPIFLLASGIQHDCHAYLFSLKKYTLPSHPMFQLVTCPHYLAECMIYLSLSLIAAPRGRFINKTLLSTLVFVVANLAITANTTRKWQVGKFGRSSAKWNIIPFVY